MSAFSMFAWRRLVPRASAGSLGRLNRLLCTREATSAEVVELEPDYPYDVDVGPLFCEKEDRCFLAEGKRCSQFQQKSRTKGMLQDIGTSSNSWGFVMVRNTSIAPSDFTSLHRRMHAITGMPQPAKDLIHFEKSPMRRGWAPVGHSAWQSGGAPATYERFELAVEPDQDVLGPWPSEGVEDVEGFRAEVGGAFERLDYVASRLSSAVAETLGVGPDAFNALRSRQAPTSLRLLSFPASSAPPASPSEAWTPPSLFTLITQSHPVLQVLDAEGRWCAPQCGPDRTLLLFGEALERLSHGHIRASTCRFAPVGAEERQLVEFSVLLDSHVRMEPLEEFKDEDALLEPGPTQMEILVERMQGLQRA